MLTLLCVAAMLFGLWATWKRPLPLPVTVYTLGILALMLLPQTVTARPRFLFTAFPLLISVAVVWPDEDDELWPLLLAACGTGLRGDRLYGGLGAIPWCRVGGHFGPQPLHRLRQALAEVDARRPAQQLARQGDVGPAASRVARAPGRQRHVTMADDEPVSSTTSSASSTT